MPIEPINCDNIFEGEIEFNPNDYSEITKVCPEVIRELMRRDDWLKEVMVLINNKLLEQCERINELAEGFEILEDVINDSLYLYYDILSDYVV